jgi:aspartyl-tRNA(Asn)/glutamyl-tRNA(Gln) amidotransferase subunit C
MGLAISSRNIVVKCALSDTRELTLSLSVMDQETLDKLNRLSQLSADPAEKHLILKHLNDIMSLIDQLQEITTDNVAPLAHPLDMEQPLRKDEVTEAVDRERYQSVAPSTRDGLYLVPRVVK